MPTTSKPKAAFKAIGYTNDHEAVFMTQEGSNPDGRPVEYTTIWAPEDAMKVANTIMQAARKCLESRSPIIIPKRG